ncbi:phospholipid carrier-dependent glycosyltransferase [Paucibacter sp. AS339]|uniref:ArnT family glycosyltransferase n=1 Tax=Paucibacter hankyongi TaxID=3133434 RepID=UPI0030A740C0
MLLILLLRLLTLPLLPLTDHTEARYAEIARLMVQTGDWISPHITPDEVFWAKPPLSTWMQALSMTVFGVSEWAGRLPAVLWSVFGLLAFGWMLSGVLSRLQILAAQALLALCPLFFISAGAVMTDATLGAAVMFVQAAWWRVLCSGGAARRSAGRWLAVGMAMALLTKGPAAAVLALLPVFMHAAWRKHWPEIRAVAGDPWVWLICLGGALPWYVMAELKTPGFVEYFVLGEHVMRFLQPGWKGDRYGFAHAQPLGMIWLFTLVAALPAVLLLLIRLPYLRMRQGRGAVMAQFQRGGMAASEGDDSAAARRLDLACYALCIALAPLLLFSAARNLIFTYAMTALPGLVILAIAALPEAWLRRRGSWLTVLALALLYAWAFVFKLPQISRANSDLPMIEAYKLACPQQDCRLSYASKPNYSAYFYTAGGLYAGMPGSRERPAFKVLRVDRQSALRATALACNKDQCLLPDDGQESK